MLIVNTATRERHGVAGRRNALLRGILTPADNAEHDEEADHIGDRDVPAVAQPLDAVRAPGHSPGHVTYLVTSGGKQFLVSADVSVLALQISTKPEWQQAIDQDPQMAVETRKKIFDRAVADKRFQERTG
jgi:glyoxylase-like metal-dependent hydrolase (beta-lactamase superfamily II)